ncbi:MAG: hypothetical protein GX606_01110, partial [Elusimicrobia bacterium]|nr:hypothetical protein [Elusimicrobiota bacterium]
ERWTLGILLTGRRESDWRRAKKPSVDLYDLKGVLTATLDALNIRDIAFTLVEDASFDPGQVADVLLNGVSVGRLGRVAEEVVAAWDIKKTPVYFAEVDLEALREAVAPQEKYQTPDEYPAMVRDVSLAVKGVSFAELKALAEKEGAGLLRKIGFVELYTGDKIEAGYKGYVLSLTYQSRERTLTDEEVATLHEGIVAKMIGAFGVKRR